MKRVILVSSFIFILLLSSFSSTLSFRTYLFIHALSYVQIAFGIVFFIILKTFLIRCKNKKNISIGLNLIDILVLILICYFIARYITSSSYNAESDTILIFGSLFCIYFYLKTFLAGKQEKINLLIYPILFAGILQAFYALFQLAGILPVLFKFKLGGSFGNPGDLANFLVITYSLSLGLFFYEKGRNKRFLLLISVILYIFVIIISMSRTAWIAGMVSSIIIIYNYYYKFSHIDIQNIIAIRKKYVLRLIFVFTIIIGIWCSYKLYGLKTTSADGRVFIWKLSTSLIHERPIFGHGYESFTTVIRQTQINYFKNNPSDIKSGLLAGSPAFAFNDYLQLTIEYGIVALVILLYIMYKTFSFKGHNKAETGLTLLTICRVTIIAILTCMLFSYPLQNPTILICFFILLAMISAFDEKVILKYELKIKYVLLGSFVLFIFPILLFVHASNSIVNGLKWKKAFADSEKNTGNYVAEYDKLFILLKHDRSFIMNYGSILYKYGNYEKCIHIYEKYGYLCLSSDMYLMLGDSYEKIKNYMKAEENYKNASYSIPHLFIPKYKLFKLYELTSQPTKADSIAQQISTMKIKIYSDQVKDIKTEINEYLLLKKQGIENE